MNKFIYNRNFYHLISNKLSHITNFFNKNSQIIFFFLIFYGLSISIFLKEINHIFFSNLDLKIMEIYRLLIILFSLAFFFTMNKKINMNVLLILSISLIFILNSFYGQQIKFDINIKEFYHMIKFDNNSYFNNKFKVITINLFNVILPLIVFSFCKNFNFEIRKFKSISLKICKIFLYFISFLMIYKLMFSKFGYIFYDYTPVFNENNDINHFLNHNEQKVYLETNITFINAHSLLLILDVYFILLIDKLFNKKENFSLINMTDIFFIIFCFLLSDTSIHLLICLLSFLIYIFYFRKNINYQLIFFFLILFITFLTLQNVFHSSSLEKFFDLNTNKISSPFEFTETGSFAFSIYVRMMHIKYFLIHSTNLNILVGNNIFAQNIYTYPHNLLVDILICSGFFGTLFFLFVVTKLLFLLKFRVDKNNFFFLNILIQSFIFSNLSGFFFTNTIFNIALAASFCFFSEKDSAIIRNS